MKALDLFCCAGGAGAGLAAAGFEVTGVDIVPRRNYPFRFVQADALASGLRLDDFDFIWASPPCQRYSVSTKARADYDPENYPDLIDPVRKMLAGHPYTCIENVPSAPLRRDLVLTGPSVGLDRIERRRVFELSFFVLNPPSPPAARHMARRACHHRHHIVVVSIPLLSAQARRPARSCARSRSV